MLWIRVRDAITGTLDGMTLADLVPVRHITLDPRTPAASRTDVVPADSTTSSHAHRSHFVTDANDRELVIRDLRVAPAANPELEILQGINLTIRKGEVHAIMGPNGSGKTTLSLRAHGAPGLRDQGRRGPLEGLRPAAASRPTSGRGWACSSPSSTPPRSRA